MQLINLQVTNCQAEYHSAINALLKGKQSTFAKQFESTNEQILGLSPLYKFERAE